MHTYVKKAADDPVNKMGSSGSKTSRITGEELEEYTQLTYLSKAEILYISRLFETLAPGNTDQNLHCHRLKAENIFKAFPQLRYNPFRESILRVFSSKKDGALGFEDFLDLCSVMSDNCPTDIKASWAFKVFDFDDDNQMSSDDLIEAVERLAGFNNDGSLRIDRASAEFVGQVIMQELDLDQTGTIGPHEFVHIVSRMPEFRHTFRLRI